MPIDSALDIAAYHASPRVSSSKLKTLQSKGPRGFYLAHVQNSWREDDKEAYLVGRALEDAVQRPAFYREHYAATPAGMKFTTKEGKAWEAEQEAAGREVLKTADARIVEALLSTLEQSPMARALIDAATPQQTILHDRVARWPHLPGIQARPDWLCLDGCAASGWRPFMLDLKSTSTLPELSSGRAIARYHYHSQASMVRRALAEEGVDVGGMRWLILGAEKAVPHRWRVIEMSHELVEAGARWCHARLDELDGYYETGEWPLVESEFVIADIPAWLDDSEAA